MCHHFGAEYANGYIKFKAEQRVANFVKVSPQIDLVYSASLKSATGKPKDNEEFMNHCKWRSKQGGKPSLPAQLPTAEPQSQSKIPKPSTAAAGLATGAASGAAAGAPINTVTADVSS